jgi:hypothetical protein
MPRLLPVAPELEEWLKLETNLHGVVRRLQTSSVPPFGHYQLEGEKTFFLKVLSSEQAKHHRRADAVSRCAKDGGAPALPPLRWLKTRAGQFIGVYPYISYRFGEPTESDATQLGTGLARLHRALRGCRLAQRIRKASNARMALVEARRQKILFGIGPVGPIKDLTKNLMLRFGEPFHPAENAQIIHADLNLGNILFDRVAGVPTFIDFENAASSWLSPSIDIAMAIQRLCLTADISLTLKSAATKALLKAYRVETGCSFSATDLIRAMYWTSTRNMCLLAEIEDRGGRIAESEWLKFFHLIDLTTQFAPLMHSVVEESK